MQLTHQPEGQYHLEIDTPVELADLEQIDELASQPLGNVEIHIPNRGRFVPKAMLAPE